MVKFLALGLMLTAGACTPHPSHDSARGVAQASQEGIVLVCAAPAGLPLTAEALPLAVDVWARAGVPIRLVAPGEPCAVEVRGDRDSVCSDPLALACTTYGPPAIHTADDLGGAVLAILAHELGHAMGADHTPGAGVMVAAATLAWWGSASAELAAGACPDAAALAELEPTFGPLGCE
jgi:hypothetical protein